MIEKIRQRFDEMYDEYLDELLDFVFEIPPKKEEKVKVVEKNGKYYLYDNQGNLLNPMGFKEIGPFHDGYAIVSRENSRHEIEENLIDIRGHLISDQWFYRVFYSHVHGVAKILKYAPHSEGIFGDLYKTKLDFIDVTGERLTGRWNKELNNNKYPGKINNSFSTITVNDHPHIVCSTINLNGFHVKNFPYMHQCSRDDESFTIRCKPLRIYDSKYVLCMGMRERIYLFDRDTHKYDFIGYAKDIEFKDDFIFRDGKVFFIYDGEIIDITTYYNAKLKGKEMPSVNKGISILSPVEYWLIFEDKCREEAKKIQEEEKKKAGEKALDELLKTEKELRELIELRMERPIKLR